MYKIFSKIKKKKLIHVFYRSKKNLDRINLSPNNEFLQASIIKFKDKKIIKSHHHLKHGIIKLKRPIQESWILLRGAAKLTYFDINNTKLKTFLMKSGDISITFQGGHELQILKKNSILCEYKTGPYNGTSKDLKYFKK